MERGNRKEEIPSKIPRGILISRIRREREREREWKKEASSTSQREIHAAKITKRKERKGGREKCTQDALLEEKYPGGKERAKSIHWRTRRERRARKKEA